MKISHLCDLKLKAPVFMLLSCCDLSCSLLISLCPNTSWLQFDEVQSLWCFYFIIQDLLPQCRCSATWVDNCKQTGGYYNCYTIYLCACLHKLVLLKDVLVQCLNRESAPLWKKNLLLLSKVFSTLGTHGVMIVMCSMQHERSINMLLFLNKYRAS